MEKHLGNVLRCVEPDRLDAAHVHAVDAHGVALDETARILEGRAEFVGATEERDVLEVADPDDENERRDYDEGSHLEFVAEFHRSLW